MKPTSKKGSGATNEMQSKPVAVDATWNAWDRYWFTPLDPAPLCRARVALGLFLIYWFCSFNADLQAWFGTDSLAPAALGVDQPNMQWLKPSLHYYLANKPAVLWGLHLAALGAAGCLALGLCTRIAAFAALAFALSYMNRLALIAGPLEPVLVFCLTYLLVGPSGARYSLDSLLFAKRLRGGEAADPRASTGAGIVLRVWRIHLAGAILMMGVSKLQSGVWWTGEAPWLLLEREQSRLISAPFLANSPLFMAIFAVTVIIFEMTFPLLVFVWPKRALPLCLLQLAIYSPLALISGEVWLYVLLIAASLIYGKASDCA